MQAAYGKSALAATSFFVYVGLGLGFLASTLSLPFGVFVLICQREPLRYIQVMQAFYIPGQAHYKGYMFALYAASRTVIGVTAPLFLGMVKALVLGCSLLSKSP